MILANAWKSKVSLRQFVTHKNLAQTRAMSSDRKRTGQENDSTGRFQLIINNNQWCL